MPPPWVAAACVVLAAVVIGAAAGGALEGGRTGGSMGLRMAAAYATEDGQTREGWEAEGRGRRGARRGNVEVEVQEGENGGNGPAGVAVEELMSVGLERYREKDYPTALSLIGRAVDLRPSDPELRAYRANALFRAGQTQAAIDEFQHIVTLEPNKSRYWSNLGSLLVHEKRYEDAVDCYAHAQGPSDAQWRWEFPWISRLGGAISSIGFLSHSELEPEDGTFQKNLDTARLFIEMREMVTELESRRAMLVQPQTETHTLEDAHTDTHNEERPWNLPMAFRGYNYCHKIEITYRLTIDARPDLLGTGVELLRQAVARERQETGTALVIAEHLLADSLLRVYQLMKDADNKHDTLLQEAAHTLRRSIFYPPPAVTSTADDVRVYGVTSDTRVHVVAVATSPRYELTNLQRSVEASGLGELTVLGMGERWEGLGSKITMMRTHLRQLPVHDVVLFVDAFDVLLLPEAARLLDIMRSDSPFKESAIVLSGEVASSPDGSLSLIYPHTPQDVKLPYVNSGGYVGYVGALRVMLDEIAEDIRLHHTQHGASAHELDDQRWFHRYFLRHSAPNAQRRPIVVDIGGRVFHTLHHIDPDLLQPRQGADGQMLGLHSSFTNTSPLLIHGNGDGLDAFHTLSSKLRKLGWPPQAVDAGTSSAL